MSSTTYAGVGTYLSSSYYLRNYYTSNRDATSSTYRSAASDSTLSLADAMALRRAIKNLGSFEYDDADDQDIRNSVSAFVSTYNNLISSSSDSSDYTMQRLSKQLKSLTSKYSDDLSDIGININDDGSLSTKSTLLSSASLSRFESLFSKDSDYMQKTKAYAKRIQNRSDALVVTETNKANVSKSASGTETDSETDSTEVAEIVAASLDLETASASTTGVGGNVDVSL